MAIIYSNRNNGAGTHSNVSAVATSTWVGGVVPVAADQVYVVGNRTTINQAAISKWTGTITITVASTTNFATSGFFYTVTTRGEIVKINYTGTTATTFTGCSVDETDPFYTWNSTLVSVPVPSDTIANGSYVHNPAYILEINSGETLECNELIIQEGGWLYINGGTLKLNQGILIRDGRLIGRSTGNVTISRPSGTTSVSTIGYLTAENYQISVIDIDGGEVRTYGTLSSSASKGATSVAVTGVTNGSFAVGDEISIYTPGDYRRQDNGYTGYRTDYVTNFKDADEGLVVCGVNGSTLYVAQRNTIQGNVRAVTTQSTQKVIEVQPDSTYFMAGDKIVINNVGYTVDSIEDSEYTLYTYDFTNPATSLSDFWVDDSSHAYSASWTIESGVGIRNLSGSYRELVHKYFWSREVVIEAELSPLDAYASGTRGTAGFGIMTSYDPTFRAGHRSFDSFKSDYFVNDDASQDLYFYIRAMSSYPNNRADRDAATLTLSRLPAMYRIDTRKMRTTVSIGGEEFTTEFRRDGNPKGLVGIFTNGNSQFRCKSLTIKVPTQKLYVTTTDTITVNSTCYKSGLEHAHPSGSKIVKISASASGLGGHTDLAFGYIGRDGSGVFPVFTQINGATTTHASLPYLQNHDMNPDYYLDLGTAATEKSVTVDLLSQKTFTHVSFVPRTNDTGGFFGCNGVAVYGSNDLTNWTTLYSPTNDTKKWYHTGSYNRIAFYPTGTVSYRYVKFGIAGDQSGFTRNRFVNVGVHDFSEGYTLTVNNAGDFAIGDKITVLPDGCYSYGSKEYEAYQARILASGADPETYYHGGWLPECTITSKSGNKLFLDKPIFWGYVQNGDNISVVKTNRNFIIQGFLGTTNVYNDSWRWPDITLNAGASSGRIYQLLNFRTNYVGSYRNSGSTSYNRGFRNYNNDYWNCSIIDGAVFMMGPDGTTWAGIGNFNAIGIFRNCVSIGSYSAFWNYGALSYGSAAYFNNKTLSSLFGHYAASTYRQCMINYNEFCSNDYGIYLGGTPRADRLMLPHANEIRYNYSKANAYAGFNYYYEAMGSKRCARIKIENNKARGCDDYAQGGTIHSAWPSIGANYFSEHTGNRISRYRNEGFLTEAETGSDLSLTNVQENFGRFGYDIAKGTYLFMERDPSRPGITRIYNNNGDDFLWLLGIEFEMLDDIAVEVHVKFDYRIPWLNRLQDDGNLDGQIRVYSVQNANSMTTSVGTTPALATGWQTYSQTFTNFQSVYGRAGVFMTRDAINGYVDIRNSSATIYTDNPTKIKVIANTFNLDEIWDQYGESKNFRKLTPGNNRTINITKVTF